LEWQYEISDNGKIKFWVSGPKLPYRLEKTVILKSNKLNISYQALNLSAKSFKFMMTSIWLIKLAGLQ